MSGEIDAARGDWDRDEAAPAAPPSTAPAITLDLEDGTLIHHGARTRLRPKTLGVLVALIERHGAVVRRDELRRLVWGTRSGNDAGPKQCIRELRRLLDDSPAQPRCIETVGRSGYRLLARIDLVGGESPAPRRVSICVGRAPELAALARRGLAARRGERAVVLIAGEPGAGKTRLTDAFLATLPDPDTLWIARGQCVPHAEAREPYGPLVDALAALAAGGSGPLVRRLLAETAPSWLAQIPGEDARAPVRSQVDMGRDRAESMPRELSDFLERLTRRLPGVLVLEDLHWADPSTLAWLAAWSLRRAPSRLLVVGTYRAEEADDGDELGRILRILGRASGCETLRLGGLDGAAVADFLAERFPRHGLPPSLAAALAERTEGHALLVDAVVERWAARDIQLSDGRWIATRPPDELVAEIAPGLRGLIVHQIEELSLADRRLLESASVAGAQFSAAALAGGRIDLEGIEQRLETLARRRRFIEHAGVAQWPDGTVAARYAFRHALYHEALYDLIPAANRQGLHRRVGARLEAAFGAAAGEIAPMLADHFERAGDWRRAAVHRGHSGAAALDRGAAREAAAQLRHALALHGRCAEDENLRYAQLDALQGLGAALIISEGFTAPGLPEVYRRAHDLSRQLVDPARAIPALAGLWNYHVSRADMATATKLADDLCRISADAAAPLRMAAHNAAGLTKWFAGTPCACLPHIEAAMALQGQDDGAAALLGEDPGVVCLHYAACVFQVLGDPEQADRYLDAGMEAAAARGLPFGQAQVLWSGTVIAREREDPATALGRATALIELCRREDIAFWLPAGQLMAGWAAAMLGDPAGLDHLRAGIDGYEAMEVRSTQPYSLGLLAEASARHGDLPGARRAILRAVAVARSGGERWYEPELHRLWAELSLATGRVAGARLALRRAGALARGQGAGHFEARALARLRELG